MAKAWRPKPFINKNGSRRLNPQYKFYLFGKFKMTACERKDWVDLGVRLTLPQEKRLVDIHDLYYFLEQPCEGQ